MAHSLVSLLLESPAIQGWFTPACSQGFTDTTESLPGMSESNSFIPLSRSASFSAATAVGLQQALPHTVPALGHILWPCSLSLGAGLAGWLRGAGRKCSAVLCSFPWLPHIALLS